MVKEGIYQERCDTVAPSPPEGASVADLPRASAASLCPVDGDDADVDITEQFDQSLSPTHHHADTGNSAAVRAGI